MIQFMFIDVLSEQPDGQLQKQHFVQTHSVQDSKQGI